MSLAPPEGVVFPSLLSWSSTKIRGSKPDRANPFVLPRGATVRDVAERVHKEIVTRLKFARIWGAGKFDGQMVQRDYLVEDNDVIELH